VVRAVGHGSEDRQRQAVTLGEAGGDVGLHVHRHRAAGPVQRRLGLGGGQHDIGAGQGSAGGVRQAGQDRSGPGRIGLEPRGSIAHRRGDDDIARLQPRRQRSADPETDHAFDAAAQNPSPLRGGLFVNHPFKSLGERNRVTPADHHAHALAGDDPRLALQADDGEDHVSEHCAAMPG